MRDLLGLADAELVDAFVDALTPTTPRRHRLPRHPRRAGRDLRALLDQVVEAIRELIAGQADRTRRSHATDRASLAAAGRRLAAIDPEPLAVRRQPATPARSRAPLRGPPAPPTERGVVAPGPRRRQRNGARAPTARRPPDPRRTRRKPHARAAPIDAAPTPPTAPEPTATTPPAAAATAPLPPRRLPPRAPPSRSRQRPEARRQPRPRRAARRPHPPPRPVPTAMAEILARWPDDRRGAHGPTPDEAADPSAARSPSSGVVTLGFPEEQAFLKDHAGRRRPARGGISADLGRPVTVRCVATNIELPPPDAEAISSPRLAGSSPTSSPTSARSADPRRRHARRRRAD